MGTLKYRIITPLDRLRLQQAGFSRQLVSAWATQVCYPSIPNLRVAAKALGMSVDAFLNTLENTWRMRDVMDKVLSRRDRERKRRRVHKAPPNTVCSST